MRLKYFALFLIVVLLTLVAECRDLSKAKKKEAGYHKSKGTDKKQEYHKKAKEKIHDGKVKSKSSLPKSRTKHEATLNSYCYDDDENPYIYYATKTAYRWNRNKHDDEIKPQGCEAKQFWLLARHGTRNPSTETLVELQESLPVLRSAIFKNHEEGRGNLCKDDRKNLAEWRLRANITEDKFLVKEGYDELEDLADRFQDRFPGLLDKPYTNGSFIFQFTDSERTDSSARAFAKGLFGRKDSQTVNYVKSGNPDTLLRFYKNCKKWKKEVDDNPDAIMQKTLFEQSEEFASMLRSVSDRLGFQTPLNLSDIDLMYTMCSFDKAWRPKKNSPWCAAFSQQDLEILEYREDLEYYWEDGYGFDINYVQACPPVRDIVDHFTHVVEEKPDRPKGIFYFTHSGTLLKVLARMGLFQDEQQLLHTNRQSMFTRQWKTSLIDSFGANLAVVLFKCGRDYKVGTFVQERPVHLTGCGNKLCPYEEFTAKYGPIAQDCDLQQICSL